MFQFFVKCLLPYISASFIIYLKGRLNGGNVSFPSFYTVICCGCLDNWNILNWGIVWVMVWRDITYFICERDDSALVSHTGGIDVRIQLNESTGLFITNVSLLLHSYL
jgi:hypothetical protein